MTNTDAVEFDMPPKYKLADIYVPWRNGEIFIVEKSEVALYLRKHCDLRLPGAPKRERENVSPNARRMFVDGFFDPADFDLSNPLLLFIQWYTSLTAASWEVPRMLCSSQTYWTLVDQIEEFSFIDEIDLTKDKNNVMWRWPILDRDDSEAIHAKKSA